MRMNQEINGPQFESPNRAPNRIQHSNDSNSQAGGSTARRRTSEGSSYLGESCESLEHTTLS